MQSSEIYPAEAKRQFGEPWQLQMFRHSLKKQQKLQALLKVLGDADGCECLLITCGDNNGALNWHFKRHGGHWTWVDAESESIEQIQQLTGDPVLEMDKEQLLLPFPDNHFEVVIAIDVHEHLEEPRKLNRELARVVKPNGRLIVTTPNGDEYKLANRIKRLIGMRPEDYGHVVIGYEVPDLEQQMEAVKLKPYTSSSYARFFTEMLELAINFAYVKFMSRRSKAEVKKGQIAPQNKEQLNSVGKSYKLYARIYPFLWLFSRLDYLIPFGHGYAVIVAARKV